MRFGIASYKRCGKISTLDFLESIGIKGSEIVLSTQTKEDMELYSKEYGHRCKVIYKEGSNASDNRNTLLEYFNEGEKIVLLDDDVSALYRLGNNRKIKMTAEEIMRFLNDGFDYLDKNNGFAFTVDTSGNLLYMNKKIQKRFGAGCLFALIVDKNLMFRHDYEIMEDNELCLRAMKRGKNCFKFNFISVSAKHYQAGGCKEFWENGSLKKCYRQILSEYGNMIEPSNPDKYSIKMKRK